MIPAEPLILPGPLMVKEFVDATTLRVVGIAEKPAGIVMLVTTPGVSVKRTLSAVSKVSARLLPRLNQLRVLVSQTALELEFQRRLSPTGRLFATSGGLKKVSLPLVVMAVPLPER